MEKGDDVMGTAALDTRDSQTEPEWREIFPWRRCDVCFFASSYVTRRHVYMTNDVTEVNLFGLDKFPLVADDVCKNPRLCI